MKNNINVLTMSKLSCTFKNVVLAAITVPLLIANISLAHAKDSKQVERYVSGLVRDAHTKKPIGAAQISVIGGVAAATTDEKGGFKIKLVSKLSALSVSAYDYGVREVSVRGKDSVVVDLYAEAFSNFYKKVDGIGGSIDNTSSTSSQRGIGDFGKIQALTTDEMLQTEIGGDARVIARSGTAGIGASVFVRGFNSLNANAQPLYVVDGVIWNNLFQTESLHSGYYGNPLMDLDLNDVESISVLKDGTSIYGSKAANGVVLIKTKRGKDMVSRINLKIVTGISTQPDHSIPVMNSNQYRSYLSEMLGSKGLSSSNISALPYFQEDPSKLSVYNKYHNNTDWSKEVYQQGSTQSYSLNAHGGDEKALYYFSLGYTGNNGVVKTTDMQRMNARFNADVKMYSNFTLGFNIGYVYLNRRLFDDGINDLSSPTWLSKIKSPFTSPYKFTPTGGLNQTYDDADLLAIGNPSAIIKNSENTVKQFRFNVSVIPTLAISKNLSLSSLFDYSTYKNSDQHYNPMEGPADRTVSGYGVVTNDRLSQVVRNEVLFDDTKLTLNHNFDKNNNLRAILGSRIISNVYESDFVGGYNSGSDANTNLSKDIYKYTFASGDNSKSRSISNYLNLDYDFGKRYFVSAAISADASSRFGSQTKGGISLFGQNWGVFPSLNAAWLLSSEGFMKNVGFVNLFKIRGGYGVTGNDDFGDNISKTLFRSVRYMAGANGIIQSSIANTEIQWETTYRANIGTDLNLFNERLSLSLDYFDAVTKDLLTLKSLGEVLGVKNYWCNGGKLSNKGFEFSANVKMLNFKNLKWELGASIGHYKNKMLALPDGDYSTNLYGGEVRTAIGQPVGVFYGYKTKGVFSTEADAAKANLKIKEIDGSYTPFKVGDIHFVDVPDANGTTDGVIDENDKQIIGNPNPDIYGTLSSKFTIKRVSLSTLFTYACGNDVYNYQRSLLEAGANQYNQSITMLSRWTADGQVTSQPRAAWGDPMGNARFSDRWIEDGSYIRLKTVTLSYDLPIKNQYVNGLNIWVSANNLVTVTKYLGVDPEFSSGNSVLYQGIDNGLLPQSRSYYFGVKFNL